MSKSSEEGAAAAGNATSVQDNNQSGENNAGQKDANGNIYEDRAGTKKIIRVVTVMAYVFSVSFAAILLSAYYVFLWEPPNPRLQRHPLSSEPQADYLTDSLTPVVGNFDKLNDTETESSDFEDTSKKFKNIFKRIMTSGDEAVNYHRKLDSMSQKLLAYEDFVELHQTEEPMKVADSRSGGSTTLPIFFKPYVTTAASIIETESINEETTSAEIVNNEAYNSGSTESNTLAGVTSGGDLEATIYTEIDNHSYSEAIEATFENNKVTIENVDTIQSAHTPKTDENFEVSLRKEDLRLSNNEPLEHVPTAIPELQIYPVENARDILDDRK